MENLVHPTVPSSSPSDHPAFKGSGILQMMQATQGALTLAAPSHNRLKCLFDFIDLQTYLFSPQDTPSLEGTRFKRIEKMAKNLVKTSFKVERVAIFFFSTISLTKDYISHFKVLSGKNVPFYIPYAALLFPAFGLYSLFKGLFEAAVEWKKADTDEKSHEALKKLAGCVIQLTMLGLDVAMSFFSFPLILSVQTALSILLYAMTISELLQHEYAACTAKADEIPITLQI